jgi:hypothetical protein
LAELRKTKTAVSQNSWCPSHNMNQAPPA